MADYNIYIHSMDGNIGGSSDGSSTFNPTAPWGSEESGNDESQSSKQPPNFTATAQKATTLAKASPWIAVAYAVVKIGYQVAKTAVDFNALESGDYRTSIAFSNFESTMHAFLHPVTTTIQEVRSMKENRIENQRRMMQRELLGDSEINRYTNRGI